MARNGSGTHSLPAGNPIVTATSISSSWANDTMNDLSAEITASLDRNGKGGMLAALSGIDGSVSAPAFSWTSETGSGLYRASAGNVRFAILGSDVLTVTAAGLTVTGAIVVSGLVDGRDIAADGATLDAISAPAWGEITGTLSAQTDLQAALDLKAALAGPTFTGTLTAANVTATGTITFTGATVADGGAVTTVDINGGTIDGAAIGAASAATGKFTSLQATAEIVEAVGTVGAGATPELDPADGTIQEWTLTIESTPTEVLATGEYITLLIDTPSYAVIWTHVDEWIGGSAPTLDTTNTNVIELWKVGTTVYGALVGVAS